MSATSIEPTRIDNLLGVFLRSRGVEVTHSGLPIHHLTTYSMRKDAADGKWVVLTAEEARAWDCPITTTDPTLRPHGM